MIRLIKEFKNVNNFSVAQDYLIITLKGGIELYGQNDFQYVGKLEFDLYPRVIERNNDSFLLQARGSFFKIKYDLGNERIFKIDIHELWNTHYINDEYIFVEYADANKQMHICRYDLKADIITWTSDCEVYRYYLVDSSHLIIDAKSSRGIKNLDLNTGKIKYEIDLKIVFSELYPSYPGNIENNANPLAYNDTLVVQIINKENNSCYLIGFDIADGKVKWHKADYSNFERYGDKLYNLEHDGQYRVLDIETGVVERDVDLKNEFQKKDIRCSGRFNIVGSHIYFNDTGHVKDTTAPAFGVLNLVTLEIEEVQRMPDDNRLSAVEFPIPMGERLYVRSAPQNNLLVYEMSPLH